MCARFDDSDPRDNAMARLLSDALKSRMLPGQDCPDAELVAAYADRGLAEKQKVQLEAHFAACARCQQLLAVLGTTLEEPVASAANLSPAGLAAPANPKSASRPSGSPRRWLWWFTPAFGAAAAGVLWMILSPGLPQQVQTAADYPRPAEQPSRQQNNPAAPIDQLTAPQPTASRRDRQPPQAAAEAAAESSARPEERVAADVVPAASAAGADPASAEIAATARPAEPSGGRVARAAAATPQAPVALPAAPRVLPQRVAGTQAKTAAAGATATPDGAVSDRPLEQFGSGGQDFTQPVNLYTFESPDGGAEWRVGDNGRIERSLDHGQTWQAQVSGVSQDLLAGSSSSNVVAWVVGRAAVILRTTDGERWQRVAGPTGITGDWSAVVSHSAMEATVVSADLRRFATTDGGRTWTEQQ